MNKIVYIEDDPDLANVIEMALSENYDLLILYDAKNIVEKILSFMPDLILIDNYIGVTQASEVIAEIKTAKSLAHIPFVLCSGHADIKTIAINISASAYLEKPFALKDLYNTIETVLEKSI
ncbi:response regulator [Pedobacter mucosus]|uniref:response regulator n=1 Tax=Pedobacter mucosus TaxID=2895286 RepID=UPI001EE490DE|nr:response regulator [Pedobacter mucosus]UKT64911.1 response regulator [Pedobacter mucosus]